VHIHVHNKRITKRVQVASENVTFRRVMSEIRFVSTILAPFISDVYLFSHISTLRFTAGYRHKQNWSVTMFSPFSS